MPEPPLQQRIADVLDRAIEATGARLVVLRLADWQNREARAMAWVGQEPDINSSGGSGSFVRTYSDPVRVTIPIDTSLALRAVFLGGTAVEMRFDTIAHEILSIDRLGGIALPHLPTHSLILPVIVDWKVMACLGFHLGYELGKVHRLLCEAYASHTALVLDIAHPTWTHEQLDEELRRLRQEPVLGHDSSSFGPVLCFERLSIDLRTHEVSYEGEAISVSPRAFKLLTCFLRHPRQVLSRGQLSHLAWDYDFDGGSNYVDVAVWELRKSLEANGKPRLIHTVHGFGYVLRG